MNSRIPTWKWLCAPVAGPIALLGAVAGLIVSAWAMGYSATRSIDL